MKVVSLLIACVVSVLLLAAWGKQDDPRDRDLKKLLSIAQEVNRLGKEDARANEQKINSLVKDGDVIIARLTGLRPDGDREKFDKEAAKLITEAAKKWDPELLEEMLLSKEKASEAITRAKLGQIRNSLQNRLFDTNAHPTTEEGLIALTKSGEGFLPAMIGDELLKDGWDRPFVYRSPGQGYILLSTGSDGKEGTGDDIVVDNSLKMDEVEETTSEANDTGVTAADPPGKEAPPAKVPVKIPRDKLQNHIFEVDPEVKEETAFLLMKLKKNIEDPIVSGQCIRRIEYSREKAFPAILNFMTGLDHTKEKDGEVGEKLFRSMSEMAKEFWGYENEYNYARFESEKEKKGAILEMKEVWQNYLTEK